MKVNMLAAIPVIAIAAGISLSACGSSSSPTGASAQAPSSTKLSPGSATYGQICQAAVGTVTAGLSVMQVKTAGAGTDGGRAKANNVAEVNSSWDSVSICSATMSDGSQLTIYVTLLPNGSIRY